MKNNKHVEEFTIYTDGGTKNNGYKNSIGSWAFLILFEDKIIAKDSGVELETTNQRMELLSAIKAIERALTISKDIIDFKNVPKYYYNIYSDSAYLVNCFSNRWFVKWETNGWQNSKKEIVKNIDLWQQLLPYFKSKSFNFSKVKGHADDYYNNYVDEMTQQEIKKFMVR